MESKKSATSIPNIIARPGDGVPIDISELIRGGVRFTQEECSQIKIRDPDHLSDIPIEEMWNELEKLLSPQKESQN